MKLVDEPSLALLEMTFDLASSDGLKTSWDHTTKSSRKYARPSSSYAGNFFISVMNLEFFFSGTVAGYGLTREG